MQKIDALTEITKHLRNRLKAAGIKALVRKSTSCAKSMGHCGSIIVMTPRYDLEFTPEQQRTVREIAVCNGLTWACGLPIDVEQMTNPFEFRLEVSAALALEWQDMAVKWPNPHLAKCAQPRAFRVG